jgi:hypothetical protein
VCGSGLARAVFEALGGALRPQFVGTRHHVGFQPLEPASRLVPARAPGRIFIAVLGVPRERPLDDLCQSRDIAECVFVDRPAAGAGLTP